MNEVSRLWNPYVEKVCPVCSNVFSVKPSILEKGRGLTCSLHCSYQVRAGRKSQGLINNCLRCGKDIKTTKYRREKGHDKYCSRKCANPPKFFTCLNCKKEFRRSPSSNAIYCSKQCCNLSSDRRENARKNMVLQMSDPVKRSRFLQGIAKRTSDPSWRASKHFQKGALHPRYKGNARNRYEDYEYKKWRKEVYQRDQYSCQRCGAKGVALEAHHVQHWATHPELRYEVSNGISLCLLCHATVHGREFKPRTYKCEICGIQKNDGRSRRCFPCGKRYGAAQNRSQTSAHA